jgi:hypothetical protein
MVLRTTPVLKFRWKDFLCFAFLVVVGIVVLFRALATKLRKQKKSITIENLIDTAGEVRDDPNEPARWVP